MAGYSLLASSAGRFHVISDIRLIKLTSGLSSISTEPLLSTVYKAHRMEHRLPQLKRFSHPL
jgi:hypothetical protein